MVGPTWASLVQEELESHAGKADVHRGMREQETKMKSRHSQLERIPDVPILRSCSRRPNQTDSEPEAQNGQSLRAPWAAGLLILCLAFCAPAYGGDTGTPLAPVRAQTATGPLRANPANSRYFTDGSGKAIYLTGSHT
jgi:hypothetical protein